MDESHTEGTADRRMLSDRRILKDKNYKGAERRVADRRKCMKENVAETPPHC